jgi:hypothetical protein
MKQDFGNLSYGHGTAFLQRTSAIIQILTTPHVRPEQPTKVTKSLEVFSLASRRFLTLD